MRVQKATPDLHVPAKICGRGWSQDARYRVFHTCLFKGYLRLLEAAEKQLGRGLHLFFKTNSDKKKRHRALALGNVWDNISRTSWAGKLAKYIYPPKMLLRFVRTKINIQKCETIAIFFKKIQISIRCYKAERDRRSSKKRNFKKNYISEVKIGQRSKRSKKERKNVRIKDGPTDTMEWIVYLVLLCKLYI